MKAIGELWVALVTHCTVALPSYFITLYSYCIALHLLYCNIRTALHYGELCGALCGELCGELWFTRGPITYFVTVHVACCSTGIDYDYILQF